MFKNLSNLTSLLRHAHQMGDKIKEVGDRLKAKRVTGSAGGGLIEVEANGIGEILRVRIDPDLVSRGDREMIEDLLPAALNQALTKAKQLHLEIMQSVTQNVEIPGLSEALDQFVNGGKPDPDRP